jgi:hypothetical protein
MKTIITHKSPDIDSCTAIWILKKFIYPNHHFHYVFVDVGEKIENIPNAIHVDTGGIDYDHHDTDEMVSSASLVYSKNRLQDKALHKIIKYVINVDHGKTIKQKIHFMNLATALDGLIGQNSLKTLNATFVILEGIYTSIENELNAVTEFETGITFNSKYGRGIGFHFDNPQLRKLVYQKGYDIYLSKDQNSGFAGYKADGRSNIDFSNLYIYLKKKEPDADWFLHSSHQLLLCGSSKAPRKKLTKYSLNQLIRIIKNYA